MYGYLKNGQYLERNIDNLLCIVHLLSIFSRSNIGGDHQKPGPDVDKWFQQIEDIFTTTGAKQILDPLSLPWKQHTPISKLLQAWTYYDVREFYHLMRNVVM